MSFLERAIGSAGASFGISGKEAPADLQPWAAEHGLTYEGVRAVPGVYLGIELGDPEVVSNVMSGALPGGELGAIAHERIISGYSGGHGQNSMSRTTNYAAHTKIAVRVPEAVGPLQRFEITNAGMTRHIRPDADVADAKVKVKELGLDAGMGWSMTLSRAADQDLMRQLLSGDFGARLLALPGNFVLELNHGSLILDCADGYHASVALEERCKHLCGLAQVLRAACVAAASPQPFEIELPTPGWVANQPAEASGGQKAAAFATGLLKHMTTGDNSDQGTNAIGLDQPLIGPWRDFAIGFEQQVAPGGLEDALALHQVFPTLPVPGNAFAVFRAPLESRGTGRIAFFNEGVITHGPVAVIFAVKPGTPDRPTPIGGERDSLRVAVKDGIAAGWVYRTPEADTSQIQPVSEAVWDLAKKEGWVSA